MIVRDFTDPSCPYAFSAEPLRLRLQWLYGDRLSWEPRMIVLNETAPEGVTPDDVAASWARAAREHGMPIDARPPLRVAPSIHACRAVVATRLRWPDREAAMLRRLRVLAFAGEPLDDSDTFELAAGQAGLPVRELAAWAAEPEVEAALREDMRLARGRACPTWQIGDAELAGLEALGGAEAALAPSSRRGDPRSVEEVLAWAGEPLATVEVAAVCDRDVEGVRAELERVARFEPVGSDGYWTATPGARAGSSA